MSEPKLGYVILYVESLDRALSFYTKVFGFKEKARHGEYGELQSGDTTLAFAERKFIAEHMAIEVPAAGLDTCEIAVVVSKAEVDRVYRSALDAGASAVKEPADQPWGQCTSYVRDLDQHLVEICSPVGAA